MLIYYYAEVSTIPSAYLIPIEAYTKRLHKCVHVMSEIEYVTRVSNNSVSLLSSSVPRPYTNSAMQGGRIMLNSFVPDPLAGR